MAEITYDAPTDVGVILCKASSEGLLDVRQQIQFQHGPVGDEGINGVQNEEVLELIVMQLRALNARVPCRENSLAITKIEEAIHWLNHRTALRAAQGVEGTHENHTDA